MKTNCYRRSVQCLAEGRKNAYRAMRNEYADIVHVENIGIPECANQRI